MITNATAKSIAILKYIPSPASSNGNIAGVMLRTTWNVTPVKIDLLLLLYNHVMMIDSVVVFTRNNQNGLFA